MSIFEQKTSVINIIQGVIDEYGGAILLELLQNADDANAKSASAVLETFVANEGNPAARSPALLFYNSAVFTARDLENIQHIGGLEEASKRHDATKVGRFGKGFNSSYHISDVVSFVTDNVLIIFDPAAENLPLTANGLRGGGLKFEYKTIEANPAYTAEQKAFARTLLSAFEGAGLGFKRTESFAGTIFRLPLRQKPSKLCKGVQSSRDIADLLVSFFEAATLGMTILKNVENIKAFIHRKKPEHPAELLFNVSANAKDAKLKQDILGWLKDYTDAAKFVMQECKKQDNLDFDQKRVDVTIKLAKAKLPAPKLIMGETRVAFTRGPVLSKLKSVVECKLESDALFRDAVNAITGEGEPHLMPETTFTIAHQFGPGAGWDKAPEVWEIAGKNAQNWRPVNVPWSAAIVNAHSQVDDGWLMCFFPIKRGTALPVHIHGFFQVTSDRKGIKDATTDPWNKALLGEVAPYAYRAAILEAQNHNSEHYYELFPTKIYADEGIKMIANRTLELLRTSPCIASGLGDWKQPSDITYPIYTDSHYYSPSPSISPVINCLILAAAKLRNQNFATFPSLKCKRSALATVEQLAQLHRLATCQGLHGSSKPKSLTPGTFRDLILLLPAAEAKVHLTGPAVAAEVFLMLTKDGSKKGQATPNYDKLPVISLETGLAFAQELPNQLKKQKKDTEEIGFLFSSPEKPFLLCKSPAAVAFALEAFPHRVVKTVATQERKAVLGPEDPSTEVVRLAEGYFMNDPSTQKALGMKVVGDEELLAALMSLGPKPVWTKTAAGVWKLVSEDARTELTAHHLDAFLVEVLKSANAECKKKLWQVSFLPILPIAVDEEDVTRQTTSLVNEQGKPTGCFMRTNESDVSLASFLKLEEIGVEVDPTILSPELISTLRKFSHTIIYDLDGSGTISLLKSRLTSSAMSEELARELGLSLSKHARKIGSMDIKYVKTLQIFETLGGKLASLESAWRVPENFDDMLSEVGPYADELLDTLKAGNEVIHLLSQAQPMREFLRHKDFAVNVLTKSDLLLCAMLTVPDLVSQAEHPFGSWLKIEALKVLAKSRTELMNTTDLLRVLSTKPIFADQWGSFSPQIAIAKTETLNGMVEPFLKDMMSAEGPTRLELPRVVCFPAEFSDADVSNIAGKLEIDDGMAWKYLIPAAKSLVAWMNGTHYSVDYSRLLLELVSECDTAILDLADIRFVPAIDAIGLQAYRESGGAEDVKIYLESPNNCAVESVFKASPTRYSRCLHPDVTPSGVSDSTHVKNLFFWPPTQLTMKDFEEISEAACADCENRKKSSGVHLERPIEHSSYYMDGVYAAMNNLKPKVSTLKGLRVYFPEHDAIGTLANMSYSQEALALAPLFIGITKEQRKTNEFLYKAMNIPELHPASIIMNAINSIPKIRNPSSKDPTKVKLTDADRDLWKHALDYLCAAMNKVNSKGESIDQITKDDAALLLVPTADGQCNFANKTFYDNLDENGEQESSNTLLWSGISSLIATKLRIQNQGNEMLLKHNKLKKGFKAAGQTVSLLKDLKNILCLYNDPGAIFFEMVQNADDAGAKKIEFILDCRQFTSSTSAEFFGDGMRGLQGPALVIKNDAQFTDEDFRAIQNVHGDHKASNEKSIGRFGMGFNAVYQITDCPSIVSANDILVLDPTTQNIDIIGLLIEHGRINKKSYAHQLEPYSKHGVEFGKTYNGTLFRLPLRKKNCEALEQKAMPVEQMWEILQAFAASATDMLLFLKSLERISIRAIYNDGEEEQLFSSSVEHISEYREKVAKRCSANVVDLSSGRDLHSPHHEPLTAKVTLSNNANKRRFALFTLVDSVPLAIGLSIPAKLKKKFSGCVSVAVRLGDESRPTPLVNGKVHCFLPIIGSAKELYHIHGLFAITADRKSINTSDLLGGTATSSTWESKWNRHLLSHTLPRCVAGCLASLLTATDDGKWLWDFLPEDRMRTPEILRIIKTYDLEIFPSTTGRRVKISDCLHTSPPTVAAAIAVMRQMGTPIVVTPYRLPDEFMRNELTPNRIVDALKGLACGRPFIPANELFGSRVSSDDFFMRLVELRAYITKGQASLSGLPLTHTVTNELAVIDNKSNPCFDVRESDIERFLVLCPHLSDRNIRSAYEQARSTPHGLAFNVESLAGQLPLLAEKDGFDFLHESSDGRWSGNYDSQQGVWLTAFWGFVNDSDINIQRRDVIYGNLARINSSLANFKLIPVQGSKGHSLKALKDKEKLTNGIHQLSIFTELVDKLRIEKVDTGFVHHQKIVSIFKVEAMGKQHLLELSVDHADLFLDFSDDERETLRVEFMMSQAGSPDIFRLVKRLPLFRIIKSGTVCYGTLDGIAESIPAGVPITRLCDGLAAEVYYFTSSQVETRQMSLENFLVTRFIPKLGKLTFDEEIVHWRLAARVNLSGPYRPNLHYQYQRMGNYVANSPDTSVTVPTPKPLTDTPPGMALALQIVRSAFLNAKYADILNNPTAEKYEPFIRHLLLSTVSTSKRSERWCMPLNDRNNGTTDIRRRLQECLGLNITYLPEVLVRDVVAMEGIKKFLPPVPEAEVIREVVNAYIQKTKSPRYREEVLRSLLGDRGAKATETEMSEMADAVVKEFSDDRDCGKFPVLSCVPTYDDGTLSYSPHQPRWTSVSECVPYNSWQYCWTQVPLLPPSYNEDFAPAKELTATLVVNHIEDLGKYQHHISLPLIELSLTVCYAILVGHSVPMDKRLCLLDSTSEGESGLKFVPLKDIVDLSFANVTPQLSFAPHLCTTADFQQIEGLADFIKKAVTPAPPSKDTLLKVMKCVEDELMSDLPFPEQLKVKYTQLIRLLLKCEGEAGVSGIDLQSIQVPHCNGQRMLRAEDACAPDDNVLVDRVGTSARIADLPLDLCDALGMQSIGSRITEKPIQHTPFRQPSGLSSEETAEIMMYARAIQAANSFLSSEVFRRVLTRLLAKESRAGAHTRMQQPMHGRDWATFEEFSTISIAAATGLRTRLTDINFPDESFDDNAASTAEVVLVSDVRDKKIFVNPIVASQEGIPLEGLICKEVDRILEGRIVDERAFISVLSMVVKRAERQGLVGSSGSPSESFLSLNFDRALDLLGCPVLIED